MVETWKGSPGTRRPRWVEQRLQLSGCMQTKPKRLSRSHLGTGCLPDKPRAKNSQKESKLVSSHAERTCMQDVDGDPNIPPVCGFVALYVERRLQPSNPEYLSFKPLPNKHQ